MTVVYRRRVRTLVVSAVTAAVLAGPVAYAPTVHAEDQRPCVSKHEFFSTHLRGSITLRDLKARWEVMGRGHLDPDLGEGDPVYRFRACGYHLKNAAIYVETAPVRNPYRDTPDTATVLSVTRMHISSTVSNGPP